MIAVKGLTKKFRETAVFQDLSFSVKPGEILFLTGRSGCGKSTALRLLSNLDVTDSGVVLLDGQPISHYGFAMWRALVTYVPQSRTNMTGTPAELFALVKGFSTRNSMLKKDQFSSSVWNRVEASRSATLEDYVAIAESVGLQRSQLEQSWSELSGGQAQRASVALALAVSPAVILLDESTSACDIHSTLLVEEAVKKCGASVIWVSHDPSQPGRVGGRVYSFENPC